MEEWQQAQDAMEPQKGAISFVHKGRLVREGHIKEVKHELTLNA